MAEDVSTGLPKLMQDLAELPAKLGRKRLIIARVLRTAAVPIRNRIAELAPDDPTTAGSQIRENIGLNVTGQTATGATALIGPTREGFMGGFAELGTAHQPATPFIAPGFDEKLNEAMDILVEQLGDAIEKELKKI